MTHDPGGKVRIPLPDHYAATAVFGGPNNCYRYRLSRWWGSPDDGAVMFLLMNPSTAEERVDDPTVAKCRRYAMQWGYAGLLVGNVFAFRATDQRRLASIVDPIGPDNAEHLLDMAREARLIVCAYGTPSHRALRHAGITTARMLDGHGYRLHVLRLTGMGVPVHPLYLPGDITPQPWSPFR